VPARALGVTVDRVLELGERSYALAAGIRCPWVSFDDPAAVRPRQLFLNLASSDFTCCASLVVSISFHIYLFFVPLCCSR